MPVLRRRVVDITNETEKGAYRPPHAFGNEFVALIGPFCELACPQV